MAPFSLLRCCRELPLLGGFLNARRFEHGGGRGFHCLAHWVKVESCIYSSRLRTLMPEALAYHYHTCARARLPASHRAVETVNAQ